MIHEDYIDCPGYHRLSLTAMLAVDHNEGMLEETSGNTTYDSDDNDGDDDHYLINSDNDGEANNGESMDSPSRSSLLLDALNKAVQSALDGMSRKTASLERELAKALSLEDTVKRANLIVSNLYRLPPGTTSAEVEDWENDGEILQLVLNTKEYYSAQEESDALFATARKMKRGSKVVGELMQSSLEGEQVLQEAMLELESLAIRDDTDLDEGILISIQERLERSSNMTGFRNPNMEETSKTLNSRIKSNRQVNDKVGKGPNPRQLKSPSGHRVLVGRNRQDNEAICFQLSKPADVWMHARGCPGAHVLLCVRRGSPEVKDEDLQFAANLAAFYSDARTERQAAITTAEPKHITKPRGAPLGAVSLRQEGKTILGRPDDVSDALKDARERSGAAWDELGYRTLGTRVKNKKKAAAVEKALLVKIREEKGKNKRRIRKEELEFY
jgi:predicted ribosome quality control (RQC) complex YloA/Tae2 family protein